MVRDLLYLGSEAPCFECLKSDFLFFILPHLLLKLQWQKAWGVGICIVWRLLKNTSNLICFPGKESLVITSKG